MSQTRNYILFAENKNTKKFQDTSARYRVGAITEREAISFLRERVRADDIQVDHMCREGDGPLIEYREVYREIFVSGAFQRIPVARTKAY